MRLVHLFTIVCISVLATGCLEPRDADSTPTPQGSPTPIAPVNITALSHGILPIGSTFAITGDGFVDVQTVEIGGTAQVHTVDSDTQITVTGLDATTPGGQRTLTITTTAGSNNPFNVEVITLNVPAGAPTSANLLAEKTLEPTAFVGFDALATTTVTLGGVPQNVTAASAAAITFTIDATTPLDAQSLTIDNGGLATAPIPVTVLDLAINEVESDTPVTDVLEFVEVIAGAAGASLEGYSLVFYNGTNDQVYQSVSLSTGSELTSVDGLLVVGNSGVTPDITIADGSIQNGPDAVALYVGSAASFPVGSSITTVGLIDAIVYETNDGADAGLVTGLLGAGSTQINEAENNNSDIESILRCAPGVLNTDGTAWFVGTPSPGAINAACP